MRACPSGLSLDRVDFLRRTLTVDRQLVRRPNGELRFGPPKTKASIRTIPVPDVVLESLSAHLARFPVTHDWGVIFTNSRGGPWDRTWFAELWRRATVEAGLPAGTRFHNLRHHTASLLIAAGCSVKVVQHQLGHASASETLDTYGHLWTTDDDRVRTAVNEALAQLGPGAAVSSRSSRHGTKRFRPIELRADQKSCPWVGCPVAPLLAGG